MIRLQRRGKKHQVMYRLGVGEKRSKLNGEQREYLGWYNPHKDTSEFKKDRIQYWINQGAQLSPTVNNLLVKNGIIEGKKIAVHNKSKKSTEAEALKEGEAKVEEKKEELKA